jgi:hypothetical protein
VEATLAEAVEAGVLVQLVNRHRPARRIIFLDMETSLVLAMERIRQEMKERV